nr:MAG TPA: hypothetical protein [Caudoviricetes sp.]
MRSDCVRHSVAFFVHGVLIDTVEHVQRGVSHTLLGVLGRDVKGGHDGGGIVPKVVEAAGKIELVPQAHISICNTGGGHAGDGLRRLVAEVADGRDDERIQTAKDAVAAAGFRGFEDVFAVLIHRVGFVDGHGAHIKIEVIHGQGGDFAAPQAQRGRKDDGDIEVGVVGAEIEKRALYIFILRDNHFFALGIGQDQFSRRRFNVCVLHSGGEKAQFVSDGLWGCAGLHPAIDDGLQIGACNLGERQVEQRVKAVFLHDGIAPNGGGRAPGGAASLDILIHRLSERHTPRQTGGKGALAVFVEVGDHSHYLCFRRGRERNIAVAAGGQALAGRDAGAVSSFRFLNFRHKKFLLSYVCKKKEDVV